MSKRPYIIALTVLLIAVAGVLGYMYMKEMPQVSKSETKAMLEGYKAELIERYTDLNDAYERLAESEDMEGWKAFSSQWIPGLSGVRPDDLDKRLPSEYVGKRGLLVSTQGALLSLWTEYNRDFTEGDAANDQRIEEMRAGIKDVFENLKI